MAKAGWRRCLLLCALVACDGGDGQPVVPDCYADPSACIDPAGQHYQFVVDSIQLPASASEAQALAFDLDEDADGRRDNALGQILATLASQEGEPWPIEEGIAVGKTIALIDIQAVDASVASAVGVQVLIGSDPIPAPCIDDTDVICGRHLLGDARFSVAPSPEGEGHMVGEIADRRLIAGPGRAFLQLSLPRGVVLSLPLVGARIDVTVTTDGLVDGRLGGAVSTDDYSEYLLAAIADSLVVEPTDACAFLQNEHVCCPPPDACDSLCFGFDCPEVFTTSCDISRLALIQCLEDNDLISSLLSPDLDLLDQTGAFNPLQDEVKDALSLGIGFTAVGASFTLPEAGP